MAVRLVDTPQSFQALLGEIRSAPLVALDTEAASFHRYHDRIYLIQLSTPALTAVIDPLGVGDLSAVGELLADPDTEKVFHDADYDLRLFDRQFGFRAKRLFDTRIAAQFLNEPGIGLGALLQKYFGIVANKRFQRADWSARPLSGAMLEYAAGDTSNLCELQLILLTKLAGISRLSWVLEECALLEGTRWTAAEADPQSDYLHLKGAKALDRRSLALLRELHRWRAESAASLDRAEFRVMGNEVLLQLAQHPVATIGELGAVKGVGRETLERRGDEIVQAIARGQAVPDGDLPRLPRAPRHTPDPVLAVRLEALKKARNTAAAVLMLAPGVLCPNGTLEAIAQAEPENLTTLATVVGVRQWQLEVLGSELLTAMHSAAVPVKEA
ncbi:MAG: ribonuclease D [Gemmatimonadales bacterium]